MKWLDPVRKAVRAVIRVGARGIDLATGGRVSANAVTIVGLAAHLPIAWAIATGHYWWAVGLLIVFGLFDTLDGELARLQKRVSQLGGFLDASTDRLKEVMLYAGAAYALAGGARPREAAWAVVACGASISVSYIKAKGEAVVASAGKKVPYSTLNRMFADGIAPFEVRMGILAIGLLADRLLLALEVIAVLAIFTVFQRLAIIGKRL